MNPQQSILSAIQLYIGMASGMAFLLPEYVMAVGALQAGACYILACRAQNRGHIMVHVFLVLGAIGALVFLVATTSIFVTWAANSEGIVGLYRAMIMLIVIATTAYIWITMAPATFRELDKFFKRLPHA